MNTKKTNVSFWDKYFVTEAGFNLSWSSVFAGVVTFFAMLLLFSLITSAVGFGGFSPTSSNPLEGVGTGVLVWSIIALILSLFAGGFVSGLAARKTGMLHGFLTWALSMILLVAFLTSTLFGVVGTVGQVVGSTLGVAGKAVESVGSSAGDAISAGVSALGDQLSQVDTSEVDEQVKAILKDTEVKELQPNYIQGMLDEAKNEILAAGKDLALNPSNADKIVSDLGESLKDKATTLEQAADRKAIENAVAKNTDLSKAEAEKAIDNIEKGLKEASAQAKEQIDQVQVAIEETKVKIESTVDDAREVADDVSDNIASASIWTFVGMLVALVLTSFAGYLGSQKLKNTIVQK